MSLRVFHSVVRLDRWTHVRFTPVGRLLLASLITVGLFALNPRATLAYQLALVVLAIALTAMLWALLFRVRLGAHRRLPRFATAGVPLAYTVEIVNRGTRALTGIEICDEPRRMRPTAARLKPFDRQPDVDGWFDRRMGYMRFVRALRLFEGVRCGAVAVPPLAPGARARVPLVLEPLRRGYVTLVAVRVTRCDPAGVFRAVHRVALADRLLVLPRRYPVSWDGDGASLNRSRHGASRSRVSGGGADFARLREYRPRDSLRHIHWRAWARLGEPVVKEFHDESPSRNALVLDTFADRSVSARAFEEAVSVAASFVADAGWRSGRLDLMVAGAAAVHLGQGNEGEGVGRMLEVLACVEPAGAPALAALEDSVRGRLRGFGACVLVLLDWDAPRRALAGAVRAAGVTTLVLVVGERAAERVAVAMPPGLEPGSVHAVAPGDAARVLASLSRAPVPVPLAAAAGA